MAHYIDADRLREKLNKWRDIQPTTVGLPRKATYEAMGVIQTIDHVLYLIDSLQQEQPEVDCNDLKQAATFVEEVREYYSNNCTWDALKQPMLSIITRCARHFYEQAEKGTIERAESHLASVLLNFLDVDTVKWIIKDFKKAMEDK